MSQQEQSGKSFRSFLGIEPSKPTTKDSVFVIIDAVSGIFLWICVLCFINGRIKNCVHYCILILCTPQNQPPKTLPPPKSKPKNLITNPPSPPPQQNEYSHGLLAISSLPPSRTTIHSVLQKYRKAGGDIIHIRHMTPEGAPLFTPGTELAEEFAELVEGMGEKERVIEKQHPSAFTGTDLERAMEGFGKRKIVLAGE